MPIAPFPHQYSVAFAEGELSSGPRRPIAAGAPPQFGGSESTWSPEELLVGAALLCLKTTFEAYARREQIAVHDWRGRATGTLDKAKGGPIFTSILLSVDLVTDPGLEERARTVMANAERDCIISRALAVPVTVTVTITAIDRALAS